MTETAQPERAPAEKSSTSSTSPQNARRKWRIALRALLALGVLALLFLNVFAWRHARSMTTFVTQGERTASPEEMNIAQKLGVLINGVQIPRPENTSTPDKIDLAYETIELTGAHELTINAWLIPAESERGVIILFHGYSGNKESLLPIAKPLHDLGWTTLLVDFHGSGDSAGNETSIGFHEAEDVVAAMRFARERTPRKPAVCYGVSMGAAAALRAVHALEAKPDAIILEAPFDRMLTTVKKRFNAMGLPAFPAAHTLVYWGGKQQNFNAFTHNPVAYAAGVTCPTLVMIGENDPRVSVAEAQSILDNLAGPKHFTTFPGVGHKLYAQATPEDWLAAISAFLANLPSH